MLHYWRYRRRSIHFSITPRATVVAELFRKPRRSAAACGSRFYALVRRRLICVRASAQMTTIARIVEGYDDCYGTARRVASPVWS